MSSIYIIREDYIDLYKNEHRQFRYKFDDISGAISFIEHNRNKTFALEHKFKIYKFELSDNFRMEELEKELEL